MKSLKLKASVATILFAGALAAPLSAHAGSVTVNFPGSYYPTGGDSGVQGYDNSSVSGLGTVLTGGDDLVNVANSQSFQAFCVDLMDTLPIGSTNLMYNTFSDTASQTTSYFSSLFSGAVGATVVSQLEELASHALPLVTNADSSAAFQIAVWDIAFGGTRTVSANGADATTVNSDVAEFLTLASEGGPITEQLTYMMDNGQNVQAIQNLISFSPVPLPGTLALLLGGLAGFGVFLKGRKSSSAVAS